MSKKKSKNHQSSNAAVNADSSDSNDVNDKSAGSVPCPHIAKSVDATHVMKSLKNCEDLKKNFCTICVKESKPLKGSEIYVCLKCGTKTCCKEHSQAHVNVPRSDLHALVYDVTSKIVWCCECSCEINEKEGRKLSNCVNSVDRQMSAAQKAKFVNLKLPDANDESKESVKDYNIKAQGLGKNGKKGGKPGIVSQSALSLAPVRGLSNLGNTCYFNSVMQCLARTQSFLCELKEMDHELDIRIELKGGETLKGSLSKWDLMSECLFETLSSLLAPGPTCAPTKFLNFVRKKHPQFEGYDQHDAHELLRHTLDSIKMNDLKRYHRIMLEQKGLLKADPKGVPLEVQKQMKELEHKVTQVQTFIPEKTFKGRLVSRVECQECHHSSEYIEGFLDLSLPILAYKPHPPVARRKGGNSLDEFHVDSSETNVDSKVMSRKQLRQLKKRGLASGHVPPSRVGNQDVDEVAAEAHEGLDVKDEVPRLLDEEKPHESGYSSEKASSSLRGSPSSEEVRSSSPCDNSWSTLPQFTDLWLGALPDDAHLPIHVKDSLPNPSDRPSTVITIRSNGTPDLARLLLHDSDGSTLNPLCRDTLAIMDQEPDWQSRIHQQCSGWSSSLESPNSLEELNQNAEWLTKSSVLGHADEERPFSAVQPIGKEGWNQNGRGKVDSDDSSGPLAATTLGNASHPTSHITEGLKKLSLGDLGRSLSPPLRKIWTPNLKRDSDFSPLKEEEGDACVDRKEGAVEDDAIVNSNGTNVIETVTDGAADHDRLEMVDELETHERNPNQAQPIPDAVEFDPWSSFRESTFNRSKESGSNRGLEKNSQTAPNNSLDSAGSESDEGFLHTKCGDLSIGEYDLDDSPGDCPGKRSLPPPGSLGHGIDGDDDQPVAKFEEKSCQIPSSQIPHKSTRVGSDASSTENGGAPINCSGLSVEGSPGDNTVKHSLSPPDPLASGETVPMAQRSQSPDGGDFEPLLSTLEAESTKITYIPENDDKKTESVEMGNRNQHSKIPCPLKKKDYRDNREASECSVESCLRQFTSIEFMTGSNKVGCSACTERQNKGAKDGKTVLTMATKQLLIGQAPPVLILHLKRFQVQLHSVRKLTKHVFFPLVLDLAPFCTSIGEDKNQLKEDLPMLYSLYGIVEHRGTLHSGHYVAYVKVEEADKIRWFCISDSHIDEVTEERVLKTEAYLLFYSKIILPTSSS